MTELTDRELNAAIAVKVCGMATAAPEDYADPAGYPFVTICEAGEAPAIIYIYHAFNRKGVPWNPCGDLRQALECVVPALPRLNFVYRIDGLGGTARFVHGRLDCYATFKAPGPTNKGEGRQGPRAICEAAWEAWRKLKG